MTRNANLLTVNMLAGCWSGERVRGTFGGGAVWGEATDHMDLDRGVRTGGPGGGTRSHGAGRGSVRAPLKKHIYIYICAYIYILELALYASAYK